jgi:hypothetical protein
MNILIYLYYESSQIAHFHGTSDFIRTDLNLTIFFFRRSPYDDEISGIVGMGEVSSPRMVEVLSPMMVEVSSPRMVEVSSPRWLEVSAPSKRYLDVFHCSPA